MAGKTQQKAHERLSLIHIYEFEGTKLYGSPEEDELRQDCTIFRLSNETGHGRITVYQVFSGIEPVSYTHLDVYKRQVRSRLRPTYAPAQ